MTGVDRSGAAIRPFRMEFAEAELDDLRDRLTRAHWPDELAAVGRDQGVPVGYVRELAEYWRTGYDWRKYEARLNELPQFTTTVDGQNLHFAHIRSPEPGATPLLLIHDWPGSFVEFLDLVGPLTDPRMYCGDPAGAFHLVIPSIPGHGFSVPLAGTGWTNRRTAQAFTDLMARLGYDRHEIKGGDVMAFDDPLMGRLPPDVTDSPVRQLARIVEMFATRREGAADLPEDVAYRDHILTAASFQWFTRTRP